MEMAGKKQNDSLIVQNNGVGSKKNTFDGGIQYLSLDQLVDFKNYPFKVAMNTELFELMQSIDKEGVLVPLLARPNPEGEGYELIAGHRRKAASKWAGVDKVPVMVVELDDNQAVIAMVDSNLQLFIGILWGFRGCATDRMAFCDTKCVSGKNLAKTLGVKRRQSFRGGEDLPYHKN